VLFHRVFMAVLYVVSYRVCTMALYAIVCTMWYGITNCCLCCSFAYVHCMVCAIVWCVHDGILYAQSYCVCMCYRIVCARCGSICYRIVCTRWYCVCYRIARPRWRIRIVYIYATYHLMSFCILTELGCSLLSTEYGGVDKVGCLRQRHVWKGW
jgi:hypothetical protein